MIDLGNQQVTRDGSPVHLTPTEFALLRELVTNRGKLLSHAHLLRRVWGHGYQTETEYVRVYVRRLRAKLESEDERPLIVTAPRAGLPVRRRISAVGAAPVHRIFTARGPMLTARSYSSLYRGLRFQDCDRNGSGMAGRGLEVALRREQRRLCTC